ncbi:unnamed protein product [Jaminaea pallidilutea]
MLPTPSLTHLSKEDYRRVYEPAEDTFVFLDALEQDADQLRAAAPRVVVEIGSGSGCVSAFIAHILGSTEAAFLCTDINPHAAQCSRRTGLANQAPLEPIVTDLLASLLARPTGDSKNKQQQLGVVDLLLFNPPYVPTTEEEEEQAQRQAALSGSWAGGSLGVNLLERLFDDADGLGHGIETILSPGGSFYFIAIKQNNPEALVRRLGERGLTARIALSRRAGGEHLFVIAAQRLCLS